MFFYYFYKFVKSERNIEINLLKTAIVYLIPEIFLRTAP